MTISFLPISNLPSSKNISLLYFRAKWAQPCELLTKLLLDYMQKYPTISFYDVDVDDTSELIDDLIACYQVDFVPLVLFLRFSGTLTILERIEGFNPPKLEEALQKFSQFHTILEPNSTEPTRYISELDRSLCEQIHSLIHKSRLMLFIKGSPSSPKCGFTKQLLTLLAEYDIHAYDHFDILLDETIRQGLKVYSSWPTYPQIYMNGKLLGGLDIVREMLEDGSFIQLMK